MPPPYAQFDVAKCIRTDTITYGLESALSSGVGGVGGVRGYFILAACKAAVDPGGEGGGGGGGGYNRRRSHKQQAASRPPQREAKRERQTHTLGGTAAASGAPKSGASLSTECMTDVALLGRHLAKQSRQQKHV